MISLWCLTGRMEDLVTKREADMGGDEVGDVGVLGAIVFFQGSADSAVESAVLSNAGKINGLSSLASLWDRLACFPLAVGSWGSVSVVFIVVLVSIGP